MPTDKTEQLAMCAKKCNSQHPQCARRRAVQYPTNRFVVRCEFFLHCVSPRYPWGTEDNAIVRCECVSPRALTTSLSPV